MSDQTEMRGIGGQALQAQYSGNPDDPAVVLLEHPGSNSSFWEDLAHVLVKAGRQVVRLRAFERRAEPLPVDNLVYTRENLRAVLGQLSSRPVLVAVRDDAQAALGVASQDTAPLITGAVLIDPALADFESSVPLQSSLPLLAISGAFGAAQVADLERAAKLSSHAEAVEIGAGAALPPAECFDALSAILIDFLERRLPRAVPEYRLGSDARTLRDALGCFATGVTVLTTNDAAGFPVGLTANSFTSVSLDPPLLLACIARSATSSASFQVAKHFAVNVLHIGQQPASTRFSRRDEDRFGATPWEPGLHGTPILIGSLATFECSRHAMHEGGDHIILVGQVERARFEPRRDPLLYFRGKYRRLHFS